VERELRIAGLLIALVSACGARSPLAVDGEVAPPDGAILDSGAPEASAEAATGPDGALDADAGSEAVCNARDAGAGGDRCSLTMIVQDVAMSGPFCFVDTGFANGDVGRIRFPCKGDGPCEIGLGTHVFEGVLVAGDVDVCAGTSFVFADQCVWRSAQHITGNLKGGILEFVYAEAPAPDQSGCASPCTAHATLHVD
jgi:hypothetical protein